jgi:cellulose synthase/poly-beta-1,6-N-acetylglucosamine synthase-like glycosyltransferase
VITLFWISAAFVIYTYVLYPLFIFVVAQVADTGRSSITIEDATTDSGSISVIISARNEDGHIFEKLLDVSEQQFDTDVVEVIVVSDGSTDHTVREIERAQKELQARQSFVKLTLIDKHRSEGKAAALNDAVACSSGDILIMTDARQRFGISELDHNTVRELIAGLSNPTVGCVSGELRFIDERSHTLQKDLGLYWRFEKWIRQNEARFDSVPGVTGAIYAMRRELFSPIPPQTILDDVLIPLKVILAGYRVTFCDRAIARDHASTQTRQEWRRKVRTLAGNWQLLNLLPAAFVPLHNRIWLQFYSHKIFRLIAPFALISMLITSGLQSNPLYQTLFLMQCAAYGAAIVAAVFPGSRRVRLIGVIHTFALLNLAAVAGFLYWISRRSHRAWVK